MKREIRGKYGGVRRDTNLNANVVHISGASERGRYDTNVKEQQRRMFNEWEIENRGNVRTIWRDGRVDVGDNISIRVNPQGAFYRYGLKKYFD